MGELDRIRKDAGGCPTGGAVATTAGALPAQWVFHAVGPVYSGGRRKEADLLASCYRKCLAMAEEHGAGVISFPSISTGAYRYPIAEAARIALDVVAGHLESGDTTVREVIFVLFDRAAYDAYVEALAGRTRRAG
jgi:O-acetyl-ADP-ribose deacetylase (regulator of RNase III)